jgi:hypothetical protein
LAFLHETITGITSSKFFVGIVIICLNVASKFTVIKLSKSTENYLKNGFAWQILVFCMSYMGTRCVYTSLFLTCLFIVITQYLCNEESAYCILPETFKEKYTNSGSNGADDNKNTMPTKEDVEKALSTLTKLSESMTTSGPAATSAAEEGTNKANKVTLFDMATIKNPSITASTVAPMPIVGKT